MNSKHFQEYIVIYRQYYFVQSLSFLQKQKPLTISCYLNSPEVNFEIFLILKYLCCFNQQIAYCAETVMPFFFADG
jgi:hypothetical protein